MQNVLNRLALRRALGPHWHHNVRRETLPGPYFPSDFQRDLDRDQVPTPTILVPFPHVASPDEILVLDVHEPLGSPYGLHVRLVYASLDRKSSIDNRGAVDRPENLHVPIPPLLAQRRVALPRPPLLEIRKHVPRGTARHARVRVMPRLARSTLVEARTFEARLVEVEVVGLVVVQRSEEGVICRVVTPVTADEAHDLAGPRVGCDGLLVVGEGRGELVVVAMSRRPIRGFSRPRLLRLYA
ncbi:beta-lactamase domain protein [Striga asiatica]|uniref:Beta-lactamase domain protein n=1 Tax=Striga asiatica TaxID=4170 RepID=A0A5A7R7U5_STRAF|nr:beta-lactamase domain protein [Striga asiatica]